MQFKTFKLPFSPYYAFLDKKIRELIQLLFVPIVIEKYSKKNSF